MTAQKETEFTGIRSFLWPIYRHEVKKVLPMMLMLVLICFNYSILRNLKDVVVITAKSSGAEVLPFIKLWVMLPTAFLFTFLYTKLANRFSQDKVFYIIISTFLAFYTLFVFVLYPARDFLHPNDLADSLQLLLPSGFKGLIAMFRNWSFTLFYVMSELWGTMVLQVLFWGFSNEITKIGEARRFYAVMGIGSNIAAIFAGQAANALMIHDYIPHFFFGNDAWEQSMAQVVLVLLASGCTVMGLFYWMNRNVLNNHDYDALHSSLADQKTVGKKKKKKLSLKESISFLSGSKYLACIAVLVVSYNLVIHLVEVIWKDQLRVLYPSAKDLAIYINDLTSLMGIFSTIAALFFARVITKIGWTKTSLATPLIMLITSTGFFVFFFLQDSLGDAFLTFVGMSPLSIAIFFGSCQNCLSKAAKYSFFDATKEMAFIPLDHEEKLKGKAAIDGVGSRLGKSGGSVIHQGLLVVFTTFSASAPYVAAIILGMIALWIGATRSLGKQFTQLVAEKDPDAVKDYTEEDEGKKEIKPRPQVA